MQERPIRVLLQEYEGLSHHELRQWLEDTNREPFAVTVIDPLGDAGKFLRTDNFDLVLLHLPADEGITGRYLAPLLHSRPYPAIVIITDEDDAFACRAIAAGVQEVLFRSELTARGLRRALLHALERKELQEKIAHGQREWQTTFDTIADAVLLVDHGLRVMRCNRSARDLLGKSYNEIIGRSYLELTGDWPDCPARQLQQHQTSAEATLAVGKRWWEVRADPLRDENELFRGGVIVIRDVTERRMLELELSEVQELFSLIMRHTPVFTFIKEIVDGESRVVRVSDNFRTMTGMTAEEMTGKTMGELFPPALAESMTADDLRLMVEGKVVEADETLGGRHYTTIKFPIGQRDGRHLLAGFTIDQTARLAAEEALRKTELHLVQQEKLVAIGQLAAGVAHEINNPLGIISQAAQNIARRLAAELPANQTVAGELGLNLVNLRTYLERRQVLAMLDAIDHGAKRATRIVETLLRFSQRGNDEYCAVAIDQVVNTALALAANDYNLAEHYDFRAIAVVRDYSPDLPTIVVVPAEIEQVLLNLFANAAQSMAGNPPERPPTLTVRLRNDGEAGVAIVVADNGCGMPEEIQRRVFEPFFTTREPGSGTGLGLYVAQLIVTRSHGGEITVTSRPGNGTTFTVRLPLAHGAAAGRQQTVNGQGGVA